MLVVRAAQIASLRLDHGRRWTDAMLAHARRYFPEATRALDDEALRARVEGTLELAATFGLTSEQDHFRLLNLTVLYGCDWRGPARLRWMHASLGDPARGATPSMRLAYVARQCRYGRND